MWFLSLCQPLKWETRYLPATHPACNGGTSKGQHHRHFCWKWGKRKVQRNRCSSEILKPSQTGAGRCSRKSQGLAIILRGSWLCLLGAQFCFLNLPSFRLKGNMCLPAAECFHQPASFRRIVDSQQPHFIGTFSVPFSPNSYFCWNKLCGSSLDFRVVCFTEQNYTHRSFWAGPSLPGDGVQMSEGQHPVARLWLRGSGRHTLALDLLWEDPFVWLHATLTLYPSEMFNKRLYGHIPAFYSTPVTPGNAQKLCLQHLLPSGEAQNF